MNVPTRRTLILTCMGLLTLMLVMPGLAAGQVHQSPLSSSAAASAAQSKSQSGSPTAALAPPSFRGHGHGPPNANYDEQLGITFTQNFTSLEYNVTAVEQADPTLGTGPGYLLNGLSDTGYWYQVGVSWNWGPGSNPGTGFDLNYEVFDSSGNSIFPTNGGGGLMAFSGPVNQGDNVTLSLSFTSSGQVEMLGQDTETGASAQVTFAAEAATLFVGQPNGDANSNGFFTGLMTEWYHGAPYYSNPLEVLYSSNLPISSAWMWMDEFNPNNGALVFASNATALSAFTANPTQLQQFAYDGITEYANALEFITGAASTSTTSTTSTTTTTSSTTTTTSSTTTTTSSTPTTTSSTTPVTTSTTTPTTQSSTSTSSSTSFPMSYLVTVAIVGIVAAALVLTVPRRAMARPR